MAQKTRNQTAELYVNNVGGIEECNVSIDKGVTALSGQNATNRTSLLTAIVGVLGGSEANLKSDTDEGSITLEFDDEQYSRQFSRQGQSVAVSGDPYCDAAELVDLFVSLLEDNPIRQAVERKDDLRGMLMTPIDTEGIERQIRELRREKDRKQDRIQSIDQQLNRKPTLISKRQRLESDLEEVEDSIEELHTAIEEHDTSPERLEKIQEVIDDVEELRQNLAATQEKIETQRSSIDALRAEKESVTDEIADLSAPDKDIEEIEAERSRLQNRERDLSETINTLSSILEFNEDLLESGDIDFQGSDVDTEVSDALNPMAETVECWTCGSQVPRGDISDKLDELRTLLEQERAERSQVQEEINTLQEEIQEVQSVRDRLTALEEKNESITQEIEDREARITSMQERASEITDEIETVEDQIDIEQSVDEDELVELYQDLTEFEYERGQLEQKICELDIEIEDLEGLEAEKESLETELEADEQELESLRTRIETREKEVIETFNDHMEEIMTLLEYENIARVWIERNITGNSGTAGSAPQSEFNLHIIREKDDGAVYEDEIDTLSESEREVIGLVVSLAGYLVHEVYETVPFMLLDSLEAIDSARISDLVDYFADYVPYLIVALLPADEQAVNQQYQRIISDALTA